MVIPLKGFRGLGALALACLCLAAASAAALAGVLNTSPHQLMASKSSFLLDGQPVFPIVGSAWVCPDALDKTDPSGTATIAQSLAALKVKILQGRAVDCPDGADGDVVKRLDATLAPLQMLWQETSKGVGPQPDGLPELVNWQPPLNSVQYPVDLPCGTYSSLGLLKQLASVANKGPALVWVPIGSSPQDGQYVCLTPQKIRNDAMTAVVGHAKGIGWMTIDPRNSNVNNGFSVMRGTDGQPNNFLAAQSVALKLQRLSTVLARGKWLKVTYPASQPIRIAAWSYQHVVTVIAVNTSGQTAAKTTVTVPALGKKHAKLTFNLPKMADATVQKRVK